MTVGQGKNLIFPTNLNKLEHFEILHSMKLNITSFSHYPNLRTLIIRKSYDTRIAIPEDIGNLTNLRKINILGCVPNFPLERLTELEFFSIIGNTINIHQAYFKRKINKLPNLEFLAINFL